MDKTEFTYRNNNIVITKETETTGKIEVTKKYYYATYYEVKTNQRTGERKVWFKVSKGFNADVAESVKEKIKQVIIESLQL